MYKKTFLILLPIFLVTLLFYLPVLTTYFSGDDFFHFRVAQEAGSKGLVYLFGFHPFSERGIAFYRPIFRELLYLNFYNLFGLNALPFRILQFVLLFSNIALTYLLMNKLFKRKSLSYLVSLMVGISGANVSILYYLAGGVQALGATFFVLLTVLLYLKYLEKRILKWKLISFLTFFLALASHETSIALIPVILFLDVSSWDKININNILKSVRGYLIPLGFSLIYLYLEVKVIGFSEGEVQYHPVFNLKTIANTFSWYIVWAVGLPESLIDFVGSGLKLNPNLLKYWSNYYRVIFPTFFYSVIVIATSIFYIVVKKIKLLSNRNFLLLLIWFPASILPLALLPLHKSAYYLAVSLPAFWGVVFYIVFSAYDLLKKKTKIGLILVMLFVAGLICLSLSTSQLAQSTYWAKTRGDYAKQIISQIQAKYPELPYGSILYLRNDPDYPFISSEWGSSSKQAFFILNGQDAINLLYKGKNIMVYYEDLGGVPMAAYKNKDVFELTVKVF
ncbi:MAG TPA: hypothetical protein VF185_04505 [Patescibacteria group bacterium]